MPRSYTRIRAAGSGPILRTLRRPSARSTRQTVPNEPPVSGVAEAIAVTPKAVRTAAATSAAENIRWVGLTRTLGLDTPAL